MLSIKDLSFSYKEGSLLFDKLNLEIKDGERVLLIAPPGEGKTTLCRILTGSVQAYDEIVLSGEIAFNGEDLLKLDIPERIKYLVRTSQNPDEMLLFSTLYDDMVFECEALSLYEEESNKLIGDISKEFELESLIDANIGELSGGEKKRGGLAEAFLFDAPLFVLDEPFDDLSQRWREKLAAIMKKRKSSFLVTGSHYLSVYDNLFDRVLTLSGGALVPYEKGELPSPIEVHTPSNRHILSAEGIYLERRRKDQKEVSFTLAVPRFELNSGEVKVLMGDNGSGKSTFSKVLSGLIKKSEGKVSIDGEELDLKKRRSSISYIMQNPFECLFMPTVRDELLTVYGKKVPESAESEIEQVGNLFGLDLDEEVSSLSYGKAKMVQAAVFYALKRNFAIFDEIDSALTYKDALRCVEIFLSSGSGVLVITHDDDFRSLLSESSLLIEEGTLYE